MVPKASNAHSTQLVVMRSNDHSTLIRPGCCGSVACARSMQCGVEVYTEASSSHFAVRSSRRSCRRCQNETNIHESFLKLRTERKEGKKKRTEKIESASPSQSPPNDHQRQSLNPESRLMKAEAYCLSNDVGLKQCTTGILQGSMLSVRHETRPLSDKCSYYHLVRRSVRMKAMD